MSNVNHLCHRVVLVVLLLALAAMVALAAKPDRKPPTAPPFLAATAVTESTVGLSWGASTDNVGVAGYNIYLGNIAVGSATGTTFTVIGLAPGTQCALTVKAYDAARNISAASNTATVVTAGVPPPPAPPANKIVGYYASWAAYSNFTPLAIDGYKVSHLNYAFANIGDDLLIAVGDPVVDPDNFAALRQLKQDYPHLKTLISVGGWSWSAKFSDVALTEASRTAFAESCVEFILAHGFDGVDIDWEYPVAGGAAGNVTRPEDKQNFTLLLAKLREKLDARGSLDGRHYLLTIAGAAGSNYVLNNTEMNLLHQYLDFLNVMTYDLHGSWDAFTDYCAPLLPNTDPSPQYKIFASDVMQLYLNAGVPAAKLVMGVPFYGYRYNGTTNKNNGLYQPFRDAGSIAYKDVAAGFLGGGGYVRYWHSASLVPWVFNGATFVSYDDVESLTHKAVFLKNQGLAGAMIWELSQDPQRVLLNAVYNVLR